MIQVVRRVTRLSAKQCLGLVLLALAVTFAGFLAAQEGRYGGFPASAVYLHHETQEQAFYAFCWAIRQAAAAAAGKMSNQVVNQVLLLLLIDYGLRIKMIC